MKPLLPTGDDIRALLAFRMPLYRKESVLIEDMPTAPFSSPVYSDAVTDFMQEASRECWLDPDYQTEVVARWIKDPGFISQASLAQIRSLLTFCIRGERFCSGHVGGMIDNGVILAIFNRLEALLDKGKNPRLTDTQRDELFLPLFDFVQSELNRLSGGDDALLFALRRKLAKELMYLERSKPAQRKRLKSKMWKKQNGLCALCHQPMDVTGSELDRFKAIDGYTEDNVRLIHHECHIDDQRQKGFS